MPKRSASPPGEPTTDLRGSEPLGCLWKALKPSAHVVAPVITASCQTIDSPVQPCRHRQGSLPGRASKVRTIASAHRQDPDDTGAQIDLISARRLTVSAEPSVA